jgi:hypothetical protein
MDEKINKRKLIVLDKPAELDEKVESKGDERVAPKIEYPNQTNPIYKNLAKFSNAKIGDKWSVKDLLR